MMLRRQHLLWVAAIAVGAALGVPGWGRANDLDAALKGGDMKKVLEILGPGETDEPPPPAVVSATAESLSAADADPLRHRITLKSVDGTVKVVEGSQRSAPVGAVRSGESPVPAPQQRTLSSQPAAAMPAPTGQPRKAMPISQPAEVPLTRPRVTYASNIMAAAQPARAGPAVVAEAPAHSDEAAAPEIAPEDRNQAAAELVKLLKTMTEPPVPAPEQEPEAAPVSPVAAGAMTADEDLARRKPLAMSPASADSTAARSGQTAPLPAAEPATGAKDLVQQTRSNLEGLLRDAKSDAFGGGAGVSIVPRTGAIPKGGWRYDGQWREGHMDGFGVLSYPDGWTYEGQWQEGRMIGQGTLTHPDGWQYTGEWRDGRMDGEGTLTYPDGWRYVGDWRDGKMHGKGELIHPEGWQ